MTKLETECYKSVQFYYSVILQGTNIKVYEEVTYKGRSLSQEVWTLYTYEEFQDQLGKRIEDGSLTSEMCEQVKDFFESLNNSKDFLETIYETIYNNL